MKQVFMRFIKDTSGATAIEYGLIAAGIAGVVVLAVNSLGLTVNGSFSKVNSNPAWK